MQYRIQLLGDLVVTSADGDALDPPTAQILRLVVALAVRPGEMRSQAELSNIVWDDPFNPEISVPMTRARRWIPIPNKRRSGLTYATTLSRADVDVTNFIDRVAQLNEASADEIDSLLGLWRGRPEDYYTFLPDADFAPVARARHALILHIEGMSSADVAELGNLNRFRELYEEECKGISSREYSSAKRLLVVDDNPALTEMMENLLVGYELTIAHDVRTAMEIVTDSGFHLDGSLVDLHLTPKTLDSQGLQVLSALQKYRPATPRVLMTSSPEGGPVSEVSTQYGLFDLLIKNGPDTPTRTRHIVDEMMSDQDEKVLVRAVITAETVSARVVRAAGRLVATARRSLRIGEAADDSGVELARDQLEALSAGADSMLAEVRAATTSVQAHAIIGRYSQQHRQMLADAEGLS